MNLKDSQDMPKNQFSSNFKQRSKEHVDGDQGPLCAKPSKVCKYVALALEILRRGKASQKELQVIGGGFVYAAMFRRPLLGSLNQVWRAITEREHRSQFRREWLPREVMAEMLRFIALSPLAFMSF